MSVGDLDKVVFDGPKTGKNVLNQQLKGSFLNVLSQQSRGSLAPGIDDGKQLDLKSSLIPMNMQPTLNIDKSDTNPENNHDRSDYAKTGENFKKSI